MRIANRSLGSFRRGKAMIAGFLSLFLALTAKSQDFNHYKPIRCEGPIPAELRTASSVKYQADLAKIDPNLPRSEKVAQRNFLLQSHFLLDELMLSGKIVFGDPVTTYLNKVKDQVLRDDPKLANSIRVYLVKSPIVNAFATNNGVILVNAGLVAHLDSEAELAFILCHEIQHYVRKHPLTGYVNDEMLRKKPGEMGLSNAESYIEEKSRYSREQELEADKLGLELFLKSGYSLGATETVFDVLAHADQHFDEIPWDKLYFEWEMMRFPNSLTKVSLDTVKVNENDDDDVSTHPNIAKRRAAIKEGLPGTTAPEGEAFIVGVGQFLNARKQCRFELSNLYLEHHAFEHAIYNSYLLQVEEPNSAYLKKVIAQSLYGLAVYFDESQFWDIHIAQVRLGGQFQQLSYFFEKMEGSALMLTAIREVWKAHLALPGDIELKAMAIDLLERLHGNFETTVDWLAKETPASVPPVIDSIMKSRFSDSLVQEDAKRPNNSTLKGIPGIHMKWSLTDLFSNQDFKTAWDSAKVNNERLNEGSSAESGLRKMTSSDLLEGWNLGIEKAILVQPIYKVVDTRRKIPVQYMDSEEALNTYREEIKEAFRLNGVDLQVCENRNLPENSTQQFNDVAFLIDMMSDHYRNGERKPIDILNKKIAATELMERYGARYVVWSGLIEVQSKSSRYYLFLLVAPFLWPFAPIIIYFALKTIARSLFVTQVFDLKTRRMILSRYHPLVGKASKYITKSILFDNAMQIKGKAK